MMISIIKEMIIIIVIKKQRQLYVTKATSAYNDKAKTKRKSRYRDDNDRK